MLLNVCHKKLYRNGKSVAAICCFILYIEGVSSLARVDSNWSHRRPNATVAQNQWGQPGYRPAGGAAYQQPLVYNRNNQTLGQQQWHLNNNRSTQYQQPVTTRFNHMHSNWNQSNYARNPSPVQGTLNQTRPPYPAYGPIALNQSRPVSPQTSASHVPENPAYSQGSFNQSRPAWSQPSAPLLPNNPQNLASNISNLYPPLPNNPNSKPAMPPNTWTPPANQTRLYPKLPNQDMAQSLPAGNNNGIPLAALQPQPNPQGPHNWHSGGQSALSYGPGYYPPPADNSNKTPPKRQGSSNPYANMFV